jgi:hypothetical protein
VSVDVARHREVGTGPRRLGELHANPRPHGHAHRVAEHLDLFRTPRLEDGVGGEEPRQSSERHGVRGRVARPPAFDREAGEIRMRRLHQRAEPQLAVDEAAAEEVRECQDLRRDARPDPVGRVVSRIVVQVDQRLGARRPQPVQGLGCQLPRRPVEGRQEATVEIGVARQHPVGEAGRLERRLDGGDEEDDVGGRVPCLAQPGVDGADAGGLVPMDQGRNRPRARAVPARNRDPGGPAQPTQEVGHGRRDGVCRGRLDRADHGSGSSILARFPGSGRRRPMRRARLPVPGARAIPFHARRAGGRNLRAYLPDALVRTQ